MAHHKIGDSYYSSEEVGVLIAIGLTIGIVVAVGYAVVRIVQGIVNSVVNLWAMLSNFNSLAMPYRLVAGFYYYVALSLWKSGVILIKLVAMPFRLGVALFSSLQALRFTPFPNLNLIIDIVCVVGCIALSGALLKFIYVRCRRKWEADVDASEVSTASSRILPLLWWFVFSPAILAFVWWCGAVVLGVVFSRGAST